MHIEFGLTYYYPIYYRPLMAKNVINILKAIHGVFHNKEGLEIFSNKKLPSFNIGLIS
jgi:hypothetical protein